MDLEEEHAQEGVAVAVVEAGLQSPKIATARHPVGHRLGERGKAAVDLAPVLVADDALLGLRPLDHHVLGEN